MSIFIIRSINRSISRLEGTTRRISDGDLDFRLETKGADRIASLTRSFDKMREWVRKEMVARSRFLMAVSHDLKRRCRVLPAISMLFGTVWRGIRNKTDLLEGRIRELIGFVKLETGFGLGLSVVKYVISSHGWDIMVESQDGKTCFSILIGLT